MPFRSTDALSDALASARAALAMVDDQGLDLVTPCRSWDVYALVNHVVGAPRFAAALISGSGEARSEASDFATGDFVAHHDETARMVMEAFGAPGALDRMVELPFGSRPATFLMFFVATDQVVHAWDLSRAMGNSTDIAPGLAAQLLAEAKLTVTMDMRGMDGDAAFGPQQAAPPGASMADKLAAFLGRTLSGPPEAQS